MLALRDPIGSILSAIVMDAVECIINNNDAIPSSSRINRGPRRFLLRELSNGGLKSPLPESPIEPSAAVPDTSMTEYCDVVPAQSLRVQTGDLHPEDIPLPPSPLERPFGVPGRLTVDIEEPVVAILAPTTRPEGILLPESA